MHPLIVVVDDSLTVRAILKTCLRREGYDDVCSFADGVELLQWLKTPQARIPALVLVDLMLPKMHGYTLIRHLKAKKEFAATSFVILTGRDGKLDRLLGRICGASVYMTKPFQTQDIAVVVEELVGPGYPPGISLYGRSE